MEAKGAESPVQPSDDTEQARQTVATVSANPCPNPIVDSEPAPSQPPSVLPVNTSSSVLEARCKRFGIPFDAASVSAQKKSLDNAKSAKQNESAKSAKQNESAKSAKQNANTKSAKQNESVNAKHNENGDTKQNKKSANARQSQQSANTKLEERRKRFGAQPEKEKSEKKSAPPRLLFRGCSEEERKLLEARMKRFGLL